MASSKAHNLCYVGSSPIPESIFAIISLMEWRAGNSRNPVQVCKKLPDILFFFILKKNKN